MNKLAGVLHVIDTISERTGKIVGLMIFLIIGLMVCDVVMRYFFNAPIKYAHEISLFMFAALSLLAGGYCLRHRAHVRVDVIYRLLSRRQQAMVDVITAGVFFLFIFILLRASFYGALDSWQLKETTISAARAILWPVKAVVPIAAALLLLQGLAKFIRDFSHAILGKELS